MQKRAYRFKKKSQMEEEMHAHQGNLRLCKGAAIEDGSARFSLHELTMNISPLPTE